MVCCKYRSTVIQCDAKSDRVMLVTSGFGASQSVKKLAAISTRLVVPDTPYHRDVSCIVYGVL